MNYAWTRYADVDHDIRFADTVKGAGHERIVFNGVREANELGTCEPALVARELGRVLDHVSDVRHDVHVDARPRSGGVYRRTQTLGAGESFRNRIDEFVL